MQLKSKWNKHQLEMEVGMAVKMYGNKSVKQYQGNSYNLLQKATKDIARDDHRITYT